ncbi:glycosyltransferase, partial [Opitutales bacterium]|nr:glycosyltransferase [Opitutales bacterium]
MKVSVVIPCYKSEDSIQSVVSETISVLQRRKNIEYEIILVNDGSPDNTFSVLKDICANNKNIIAIDLSKNFGQACAMLAGYSAITGDIVVHSDDDGQTPIDYLWNLVDKLIEGHDIVFAQFNKKKNSFIQNIGTWINIKTSEIFIGKPKGIHLSNFFCCKSFVIKEISKNNNPYPFIGGLFIKSTHNFGTIETLHRSRTHGKSNYSLKKMIGLWLNGLTAFSVVPLRFASVIGMLTSFTGFSYACYLIIQRYIHDTIPEGYTSIMSAVLFVSGIIML